MEFGNPLTELNASHTSQARTVAIEEVCTQLFGVGYQQREYSVAEITYSELAQKISEVVEQWGKTGILDCLPDDIVYIKKRTLQDVTPLIFDPEAGVVEELKGVVYPEDIAATIENAYQLSATHGFIREE